MRVALLQNQVGVDGRSRVLAEIVHALRADGTTPTLFTFARSAGVQRFATAHGLRAGQDFTLSALPRLGVMRGASYQMPALAALAGRRLRRFDVVVNSNNVLQFLPPGPRYVHYIHYPPEAELADNPRFRRGLWRAFAWPLRILYRRPPNLDGVTVLTNSRYTQAAVCRTYGLSPEHVSVVYPPCHDRHALAPRGDRDPMHVISLGALLPDKRQLEQVRLAASLPEFRFTIMGAAKSPVYLKKLRREIERLRTTNVTLVPGPTVAQRDALLHSGNMFIHSKQNEHFGIATVEAVMAGCIPVVHDSGGQREIVQEPALRFADEPGAKRCLLHVGALDRPARDAVWSEVASSCLAYSSENFRASFVRAVGAGT